jgi:hypothetical protein
MSYQASPDSEQGKIEAFENLLGRVKANQLYRIFQESFPTEIWDKGFKKLTTEEAFAIKAAKAGFTKTEINALLELQR